MSSSETHHPNSTSDAAHAEPTSPAAGAHRSSAGYTPGDVRTTSSLGNGHGLNPRAQAHAPSAGQPLQRGSERHFHLSEHHAERAADRRTRRLAQGLGLFSVGLGVAELAAPRAVARVSGMGDAHSPRLVRIMGAREVATGLGLLSGRAPSRWMLGRVAGDALDLGVLATAHAPSSRVSPRRRSPQLGRMALSGAMVLGISALDVLATRRAQQAEQRQQHGSVVGMPTDTGIAGSAATQEVRKVITVNKPLEEVYAFWRNFENLPRFMDYLEAVTVLEGDGRRSRWTAKAPMGRSLTWDAEITNDVPNSEIAWRSLDDADIENHGVVRFRQAPGGRGTEVHVDLHYSLPGGKATALLARFFPENADREVYDSLRTFKQILETGTAIRSDALVNGTRLKQGPAQPPAEEQAQAEQERTHALRAAQPAAQGHGQRDVAAG